MLKFFGRFRRAQENTVPGTSEKFFLEKYCTHGFPLTPSCMTFDPYRKVLHIGTAAGEIRVIGQPGVELTGLHDDVNKVLQILPFASEPSLITVCSNNLMHKWSMVDSQGNARLVLKSTYKFQGGLAKTITTCCLPPRCDCLFVGTLGGITYPMDTEFDGMSPEVLSWSRARAYLKYDGRDVPGEVCTLDINPANLKELLIGYQRNYLELWDALSWKPIKYFGAYKSDEIGNLLATSWHSEGTQFVTTHGDGSFLFWNVADPLQPFKTMKPHGSEYVQDMRMVIWPDDDVLVVSGGSPQSVVDGHCISIMEGEDVHTLQLTSPVKGMHVLDGIHLDKDSGIVNYGDKETSSVMSNRVLILLLEQEILFIELSLPELPLLRPPYLYSIHNSPVRCLQVYEDIPKDVWQTIIQAGRVQLDTVYTGRNRSWPIDGGLLENNDTEFRNLLLTGHEDGTIKFWDIGTVSMRLLYILKTASFFSSFDSDFGDSPENEQNVKQVSFWDPRSDDDQVQISCISFYGDQLMVGFVGGSALHFSLNNQSSTAVITLHRVSILREDPRQRGRNWQAPMEVRLDGIECGPGYQPTSCIAIFPNVPVTVVSLAKDQKLIGIGSVYGFAIIDGLKMTTLHVGSTHQETEEEGAHLSRMQSIRKSFRQSLKRLNVRRSMRGGQSVQRSYRPALVRSGSTRPSTKVKSNAGGQGSMTGSIGASPRSLHEAVTPAPPRRDSVKTITFSALNHIAGNSLVYSVLVGTNQGGVLAFSIDMPSSKHRENRSPILMPIEREFNVKKNYSVIFCGIMDHQHYLLDVNDSLSYHQNTSKGSQWMVVVTEDAIKVLGLPSLKKKFRLRLKQSDNDEYHVQSGHFLRNGGQSYLGIMGSDGFVCVYTLPELKLVSREDCVDAADAVAQRNFSMTQHGLLVHMRSPSEITRGAVTDESKMELHFTIPCKSMDKFVLGPSTPKSPSREPAIELVQATAPSEIPIKQESSLQEDPDGPTSDMPKLEDESQKMTNPLQEELNTPAEDSDIQLSCEENILASQEVVVETTVEDIDNTTSNNESSSAIPNQEPENDFQERAL